MASTGVEYKVLLDGKPVEQKVYDMIDAVTVDQAIDLATEARVEIEMCADDKGNWHGLSEAYAKSWRRLRVEVRNGSSGWVPLIDGPIVERYAQTSSEPGQSMLTLIARDDSVYLNQTATVAMFEGKSDVEVARQLLMTSPIKSAQVDSIPDRPKGRRLQHVQAGTQMDLLLEIAAPYDMHVYVVPGTKAGQSTGCLKAIDTKKKPTLPSLVLVGPKRNIETFHARDDVGNAAYQASAQLDIDDLTVSQQKTSDWKALDLLGDQTAVDDTGNLGTMILPPGLTAFHTVAEVVKRLQQKNSYTVTATGMLRGACYPGVLTPYDVVEVSGVDPKQCTKYVIREVTHSLGRSEYRQDFTLYTNAVAKTDRGGNPVPAEVSLS